jgi:hypothetical protein
MKIDKCKAQRIAARYAFHMVSIKRALDCGGGQEYYDLAMMNYDGIIERAANGHSEAAMVESMKAGFVAP